MSDNDPIAEAYRLLDRGEQQHAEHELWRATRDQRPDVVLPEPPSAALSASERRAFDDWLHERTTEEQHVSASPFSEMQIEVLGGALAAERDRMRDHVAAEIAHFEIRLQTVSDRCSKLETEFARRQHDELQAQALCEVRADLGAIRSSLDTITRERRGDVIDLPRKGAAA